MKKLILFVVFTLFPINTLLAQVPITTGNVISIDFNSFDGSGFAPSPAAGQLDSDEWRVTGFSDGDGIFGGTHTATDFARGTDPDGVTTGGTYAFEVSTFDFSLGVQPGGTDWTPGTFTLRLVNNTGSLLTELNLQYDLYILNDQGRANFFNFSYSIDDISYTPVTALDDTSTDIADVSPVWTPSLKTTTITGLSMANNDTIYLQWTGDDVSGAGSRDEFAIDNILISEGDTPLPVELSLFQAVGGDNNVVINWTTSSEINNLGFEIYRSLDEFSSYELLTSYIDNQNLKGAGSSSSEHKYAFTDIDVINETSYWYKLIDVSSNGVRGEHGPVFAKPGTIDINDNNTLAPKEFTLLQNYPNPFNPQTNIQFEIPQLKGGPIEVELSIYNLLGQKVKILFKGKLDEGLHSYTWNGTGFSGKRVSSGIYIYQIESSEFVSSNKMILLN